MSATAPKKHESGNRSPQHQFRVPSAAEVTRVKAGPNLGQRDRSVPYKKPYVLAVLATLLFYLLILAVGTAALAFALTAQEGQTRNAYLIAGLLAATAFTWLVAYLLRRRATCPLCKCTPLLDNLALKHQKARKIWPLNYGNSAVLSILCTQRMRCMYCGTPFDILKVKNKEDMEG
ncbi:hypothetical protein JIN77_03955 [Verrucomicrobiaceae bacterium R5-34]|uniref:Uncharacterized protein n=1 Tax=Oceaniferula flava TaxID=2800421 RepID=A0AAE2VD40_9BACT|nr:hypothetical protein [Oceaniferula flavus]MBK1829865.1 hypothetical protein [Verrucomicrobiaceae bacterium R5-34]MBK1856335.1 hypothetical protein [Oceaniferula flavus]MBM1137642.1 hypothetical protein [Oceaniferula flavus]